MSADVKMTPERRAALTALEESPERQDAATKRREAIALAEGILDRGETVTDPEPVPECGLGPGELIALVQVVRDLREVSTLGSRSEALEAEAKAAARALEEARDAAHRARHAAQVSAEHARRKAALDYHLESWVAGLRPL